MSFAPTAEQQEILDAAAEGGHVAITAGAGTGKTATLVMAADVCDGKGLYVAFNKAIQKEAEGRFPSQVQCSTAHSLAYRAGGHKYRGRLNAKRLPTREIVEVLGAHELTVWFEDDRDGSKSFGAGFVAAMAMATVKRFCQSADPEITNRHVPVIDGLDLPGEWTHQRQIQPSIVKLAKKAWWDDLRKYEGQLRFEHDHYLKLWQLSPKSGKLGFDYVFADEAQDLSPVMVDVFQRNAENGAQVLTVGDGNQAIYSWRGAVDAMELITPDAPMLPLSWCWRFGEQIAVPVNSMLEQLNSDLRLVGKGGPGSVEACPDARVVLSRTNASIIEDAIRCMDRGVRFAIVGNMPGQVISFAEGARNLMAGQKSFHPELAWADSWAEVLEYVERDALGQDLSLMVRVVEEYGVETIISAMKAARDERTAERVFSTMHAAKGREWPEVRLAGDYPIDETGKPVLDGEMMRLYYVAASRAERVLDIDACLDVFYPDRGDGEEG